MLLRVEISLRSTKRDGSAITAGEYARAVPIAGYTVTGLGEEEQSVNLALCSLSIDMFKGLGASRRFFEAIHSEIERLTSYVQSLNVASFNTFSESGIESDLLIVFTVDESTMDFNLPSSLISSASSLGLQISLLVNAES